MKMADTCLKQTVNCIPESRSIDSAINTLLEICIYVFPNPDLIQRPVTFVCVLNYSHDVGSSITVHATIKTTFLVIS